MHVQECYVLMQENALLKWKLKQMLITEPEERRGFLKGLLLQWHPDKFLQSAGNRIAPEDQQKIMQRVAAIFCLVNAEHRMMA